MSESADAPSCACKGIRFCASCKDSERVLKLKELQDPKVAFADYETFVYNPADARCYYNPNVSAGSSVADIAAATVKLSETPATALADVNSFEIKGMLLIQDFLSIEEEEKLVENIEKTPWVASQSGRRKQDYGPRVNFKHHKVKCDRFVGVPTYADELLSKMTTLSSGVLGTYQPFELCNLEYEPNRLSAIELHQDDTWIWGNRLISLNLLSDSVMTFENAEKKQLVFMYMARRHLLSMFDDARYQWRHGIFSHHIVDRRIALTMREPAPKFQPGGELYEKYGKELIERGNQRIVV
uniref:Alpha-ketoglutarate-dependent dioxygenase alkB-like protein 4 n=1 Tax=Panagrellus redivivus TaxID=6233 RepID=A0A7E4ZZ31_PANRE